MRREPRVNDYVIWDRHGLSDEGWIYFVSESTEQKKGFPTIHRYVTIEVGVKKKPECQYDKRNPHNYVHILLLCYESQWKELRYVKKRKSKYDNSIVMEFKENEYGTTAHQNTHRGQ